MARKSSSPHGRCHIGIDPDIFGAAKATAKIDEIKIILSRNMFEFIVVNFSQVLFAVMILSNRFGKMIMIRH